MKSPLLLLMILLFWQTTGRADYWNADYRLPRLRGIQKITVKETRWSDASANGQAPVVYKSVLWLNDSGLVAREDRYEQYSWISQYNTYDYRGSDTAMTTIRIFTYPDVLNIQKPSKTDSFVQTVEFVDNHSNPGRHEWNYYGIDSAGAKRLLNSTITCYDLSGRVHYSLYKSFGSTHYMDSAIYQYVGDTQVVTEYTTDNRGTQWPAGQYQLKRQETLVKHRDSLGRLIRSERIADTYSGTLRKSELLYDKQGRYLGERYEQQCQDCKTGWKKYEERCSYDARSRLKSIVYTEEGKPQLRYDLVYEE